MKVRPQRRPRHLDASFGPRKGMNPPPKWTDKVCPWTVPPVVEVAPCGCTCWRDSVTLCAAHEAAKDSAVAESLILRHVPFFARNPRAGIFQAACRYSNCEK